MAQASQNNSWVESYLDALVWSPSNLVAAAGRSHSILQYHFSVLPAKCNRKSMKASRYAVFAVEYHTSIGLLHVTCLDGDIARYSMAPHKSLCLLMRHLHCCPEAGLPCS